VHRQAYHGDLPGFGLEFNVFHKSHDSHSSHGNYGSHGTYGAAPLLDSRSLAGSVGRRVRIAGVLEAQRSALTVRGRTLLFLTLDDEFGLFEVTVFPDQARTCDIGPYGPYLITGTVEDQYGAVTIRAEGVELVNDEPMT